MNPTEDSNELLTAHGGPHVFVEDLEAPQLSEDDHHHLVRSLRLRAGDRLTISDGAGSWRSSTFGGPDDLALGVDGAVIFVPAPPYEITVGFALVKGSKPEFVVQKLTELGVDQIVPFVAERSIVRWDPDKAAKNLARLQRVSHEAAMQSHRERVAIVKPVATFAELISADGGDGAWIRADMVAPPPSSAHHRVLIGPEGGWSPAEIAAVPEALSVGRQVLRAETAAIAVGATLAALRDGSVRPAESV